MMELVDIGNLGLSDLKIVYVRFVFTLHISIYLKNVNTYK